MAANYYNAFMIPEMVTKAKEKDVLREYPVLPEDFTLPDLSQKGTGTLSLVQPSIETEQAPGVTTMARANAPLVTQSGRFKLTGETAGDLISEVRKKYTNLKSLELNPDGGVKLESHPMPQTPEKPVGEVRGTEKEAQFFETPEAYQESLPAPAPEPETKSFWRKAGEFLTSPTAGYVAGQIGAALATTEGQREFGLSMAKLNLDQVYAQYVNELRAGKSPDELLRGDYKILPAEYRSRAAEEMRLEREAQMKGEKFEMEKEAFELDKVTQDIRNKYMTQLTSYQAKLEQGMLTKEEKIEQKNLDRAISLAVGEMNRNDWMGLGRGIAFNFRTGQFVMAADPSTKGGRGIPIDKINPADYKLFETWVSDNYLQQAIANKREEIVNSYESKEEGEAAAKSIDMIKFFQDKDGALDVRAIKKYLNPNQKLEFNKDVSEYLTNYVQGIPPTSTQVKQSRQYQMNQPFQHTFREGKYKGQTWMVKPGAFDSQGNITSLIPVQKIR